MSKLIVQKLIIQHKDSSLVNISFTVTKSTALIGQSGSGKSLTLKSLLKMLPQNLMLDFEVECDFELNPTNVAFVPQNPFTSLSSMTKIKDQFFCLNERKIELLELVGLEAWVLERFPNQLSGGQLQRVIIAIALTNQPKLLLLDEPTTALDKISKAKILELIHSIQEKLNLLILLVTHDISSIIGVCEDIIILKDGIIIEEGKSFDILNHPKKSYTKSLINSGFENREFRK
ncbi:MAG: ATP-binding cassette domain-containing protein [Arcobacteraceae bacterium]